MAGLALAVPVPSAAQAVSGQPGGRAAASGATERPRAAASAGPVWLQRETRLMGTRLSAGAAAATREEAIVAVERAFAAVRGWEELLSTWRPDTELAAVNAAPPGRPTPVSIRLRRALEEAAAWRRRTGGAFDPAVGALVEAWDLRGAGRRPSAGALERARAAAGPACFRLGPGRSVTRLCAGAGLDAGAFGKGLALRDAGRALERAGARSATLDFGGQLLFVGDPPAREAWTVEVAHPARRDATVLGLRVPGGSVATTSAAERFVEVGGARLGHVLDPRSGTPVPAWGSATVAAADPAEADALSTALFVMGPGAGCPWAAREGVAALFLEAGAPSGRLTVRVSPAMRAFLADQRTETDSFRIEEIDCHGERGTGADPP